MPGPRDPSGHHAEHDGDQPFFFAAQRTHAGQFAARQFARGAGLFQISGLTHRYSSQGTRARVQIPGATDPENHRIQVSST